MMDVTDFHPENERRKREYIQRCEMAKGLSAMTVGHIGRAIRHFEIFTGYKDFKTFDREQAIAFCNHLANDNSPTTGKPLSVSTRHSTLVLLGPFFRWLASEPGYKSAINIGDIEYLTVNRRERAIALHRKEPKRFPSCEQVVQVLRLHPVTTDLDRRDRALLAFLLLTCARDDSVRSLKLEHIDLEANTAFLDARVVSTKNSKTFKVWFFPVDPAVRTIVADWVGYLRGTLGFEGKDPLFPATAQVVGANQQFTNDGLSRHHWKTTGPIRDILRKRLTDAGESYYNPHLFRKTLVQLGEQLCTTPEEFKVWSQNMGHEEVLTTFRSYGQVPTARHAEIMARLGVSGPDVDSKDAQRRLLHKMLADLDHA